jgi:hypothetical protein
MADKHYGLFEFEPAQLNRLIAILFMIGSALFALGCVLYLGSVKHELVLDSVFFVGSLFFTSAAYCQFHQSIGSSKTAFYSALSQFIGTLMFNMNTFDAFFDLNWIEQDFLVWTPNIFGSILFQISGSLAMLDLCKHWWCWNFDSMEWWSGTINFIGCIAFLISAVLSFAIPAPLSSLPMIWATMFTLVGACCFFIGAMLSMPQKVRHSD